MNQIPLPLLGNQYLLDNSALQTIMTCPRSAMISSSLRLKKNQEKPALFFGKAIHEALEIRDLANEPLITPQVEDRMVESLMDAFKEGSTPGDYRDLTYAIKVIKLYNEKYPVDTFNPINLPNGDLAVEVPFALPIAELSINREMLITDPDINDGTPTTKFISTIQVVFTGKIDRIASRQSQLFIFDHKTTSMGGAGFFDEFQTGLQFKGYTYAAQTLLQQKISGSIINAIFSRKLTKTGKGIEFFRQPIYYSDSQIQEWKSSFISTAKHFISLHLDQPEENPESNFPLHTQWCKGKYGKCPFFEVCALPVEHRDALLFSSEYIDNTWNPLTQEEQPFQKPEQVLDLTQMFKQR